MERDFLGLSLKESLAVVKEEIHNDGCKDPGLQWQFSNKASALSHLMSFKTDALMSSGFTNISTTTDAFDTSKKRSVGEIQNLVGTTVKQPLLGGIPVTAPHSSIPTVASIAGTTEPWNGVKASGSPAQLTIFYAGAVHVYDDITPEKAQAMMFLAGNGSSITFNTAHPKAQVQAPSSKLAVGDGVPLNQPKNTQPCSGLSSPLSVSSHTGAQSLSGSTSNDELMEAKTTGVSITPVSKVEPQKANVVGSVTVTSMLPSAVPQARKASLARFLEKRKERAMNAAPYNLGKNSTECTAQECDGANFASTAAGTGCLSESKESNHDRV
ncbi:protein TIFY 6B-like isoform X5 [Juglans microcarpa x Juglans regia]|uniref:protein TIFY 6B-like isoform X5 n=1 Tax=Juglans microcarpa x Juglans regia TaxID=2249226 RepID=UPI001B7DC644|nr:protein TIFY 6B-like isoform X5 [Juglans microcarpa x Juglans regia]